MEISGIFYLLKIMFKQTKITKMVRINISFLSNYLFFMQKK